MSKSSTSALPVVGSSRPSSRLMVVALPAPFGPRNPKIVQERLGHGSIQITLDTYSHVAPGLQQIAAESD
jgi:integrase